MDSEEPAWLVKAKRRLSTEIYPRLNRISGGTLDVLQRTMQSYTDCRAGEAAASMAYYALFSLFPLLLFLVAGASFVLEQEFTKQQLLENIRTIIPVSQSVIENNLDRIFEQRSAFGLVALVSLLWSASAVFTTLAININRAWSEANVRTFLQARLVALTMVAILVGVLILSVITSTVLQLLAEVRFPLGGSIRVYDSPLWRVASGLLPFLFRLFMLFGLYYWVPNTRVRRMAAFWGALVAAVLWEIITRAFIWYLGSGFARFELVYGSLGTIVVLMVWIYLGSTIALFGAHLTASLTRPKGWERPERESRILEASLEERKELPARERQQQ